MEFQQTLESVYERIKERIGSPFFGSALLSWPLINYKFLVTCLGDGSFIEKVYFIETYIYPDLASRFQHMVLIPGAVGLFYTLLYPLLDIGLTAASKWLFSLKQRVVLFVERKTPIDSREQADFFAAYDEKVKRLDAAFADQTKRHMDQFAESRKEHSDVTARLQTQCLRRLADRTGLQPEQIAMIPNTEPFILDQPIEPGAASLKTLARQSILLQSLIPIIEQVDRNSTPNGMGDRVANLPALAQVLNLKERDLLDSLELIQVLGIVSLGAPSSARTVTIMDTNMFERTVKNLRYIFAP